MYIQFFGHSITNTREKFPIKTFADLIIEKYHATSQVHSRGVAMCSEERILYDLKKTKKIDVAIIFHSIEDFCFYLPDARDYNILNSNELEEKFAVEDYVIRPGKNKDHAIENCELEHFSGEEIKQIVSINQKFLISRDLLKNRYYGALIQIDQYCTARKIPVIHCPISEASIPSWFKFTSGIVDYELNKFGSKFKKTESGYLNPYYLGYHKSDNSIDEEGNIIIANKLSEYIDQLLSQSTSSESK